MMDKTLVVNLKDEINTLNEYEKTLAEQKAIFDEENRPTLDNIVETNEKINALKEEIKEQALLEYDETEVKKLYGGIGIRCSTKIEYKVEDALMWAKSNMAVAVKEVLDDKMFKSYVKGNDLEFVTKTDSTSVTFPKEIKIEE